MLAATLFMSVIGLVVARLAVLGAVLVIMGTAAAEILLLSIRHGHHAWHYGAGFGLLVLVGETCFFGATWLLYDVAPGTGGKTPCERSEGARHSGWFI